MNQLERHVLQCIWERAPVKIEKLKHDAQITKLVNQLEISLEDTINQLIEAGKLIVIDYEIIGGEIKRLLFPNYTKITVTTNGSQNHCRIND